MYLYIFFHILIYLFIYLFFILASCSLGLYKVSLQVVSPRMIFHCKYLALLFLLVYTKICKIM